MPGPPLPPQASYLAPLVGRWAGEGEGLWTADPPFRYREEVTFAATGKPFLAYQQRTQAADGRPLHAEAGYLRATGDAGVELLIVQPTGFAEIHLGRFTGTELQLDLAQLDRTPTALAVTDLRRQLRVEGDRLSYLVRIAMNGEALADHLRATLTRQPDGPA